MPLSRDWTKSSYSDPNGGNCVEARHPSSNVVQVRDSMDPTGPILTLKARHWASFLSRTASPTDIA